MVCGLSPGGGSLERTRLWTPGKGPIPCYTGNLQGIFTFPGPLSSNRRQNVRHNQRFRSEFPTQENRELNRPYQGIKSPHQGILPDQGSQVFIYLSARIEGSQLACRYRRERRQRRRRRGGQRSSIRVTKSFRGPRRQNLYFVH